MFIISTLVIKPAACVVRARLNHSISTTAGFEFCSTLIAVSIRKINLTCVSVFASPRSDQFSHASSEHFVNFRHLESLFIKTLFCAK